MKLGDIGDMGRRKVPFGDKRDTGNVCCVGVVVADGLNKNVGDMGDISTAHMDPISETKYPGDIA
jgi:hypothetical protein